MDQTQPKTDSSFNRALPAAAADLVGLLLLFVLFFPLRELFLAQTIRGGMIFLIIYLAFSLAVNALKRLERQPGPADELFRALDYTRNTPLTVFLALMVIAGFLVVQIDLNRAADSMIALMSRPESYGHEGEITLYYSFGPLFLWLMIGVIYLAAMLLPTQRVTAAGSRRYALTEFVSLGLINLMIITTAAYLGAFFERVVDFSGRPLLAAILALLILEIAFDPARLRHALKQPLWLPLFSFALLLLGAAWLIGSTL